MHSWSWFRARPSKMAKWFPAAPKKNTPHSSCDAQITLLIISLTLRFLFMQIFFNQLWCFLPHDHRALGWGIEELGWVFIGADYWCSHVQIITS